MKETLCGLEHGSGLKKATVAVAIMLVLSGCVGPLAGSQGPEQNTARTDGTDGSGYTDPSNNGGGSPGSVSDISGPDESTYSSSPEYSYDGDGTVKMHFIDVGQSDSTLIEGPKANILIDTGDWQAEDVVSYLESEGVETVDLMILTHLDADHIGQAGQIIRENEVKEVWMSGKSRTTETFKDLIGTILNSEVGYYEPRTGERFNVGEMRLQILYPDSTPEGSNVGIATRLLFGETEALFTGDAEAEIEQRMLQSGQSLSSDIYQVAHHGSDDSSTEEFIEAVDPSIAVYSAGKDNQYGHPSDEVISRLNGIGADVYGTPVHGTIVVTATSEGEITVETENNEPMVTVPTVLPPRVHRMERLLP